MKNKTNGTASTAKTTTNTRISDHWMRQIERNAIQLRGKRAGEFAPISVTLKRETARRANQLAYRVARRTGVKIWQAKSAVLLTAFQMACSPGARSL